MTTKEKPKKVALTPFEERAIEEAREKQQLDAARYSKAFAVIESIQNANRDLEKTRAIIDLLGSNFQQPRFNWDRYEKAPEDFLQARDDYQESRQKMLEALGRIERIMNKRFDVGSNGDEKVQSLIDHLFEVYIKHLVDTDWKPQEKEGVAA